MITAAIAFFAVPGRAAPAPGGLDGMRVSPGTEIVGASDGRVAAWDRDTGVLSVWSASGERMHRCEVNDARLGAERGSFAVAGDRALLGFLDPAAGSDTDRKVAVLDLRECRVVRVTSVPGLAVALAGGRRGWLAVVSPDDLVSRSMLFLQLDAEAGVVRSYELGRQFAEVEERVPVTRRERPRDGMLVATEETPWVLPHAAYELWRLPHRGLPFRRVEPPACLAATGRELVGEENAAHVLKRAERWPAALRAGVKAAVAGGRVEPTFLAAATQAVANARSLAVTVRDPLVASGVRLDVWDMVAEAPHVVTEMPADAQLVALASGYAWILTGEREMARLVLPEPLGPLDDPCEPLATLYAAARPAPATVVSAGMAPQVPRGAADAGMRPAAAGR